MYIYVAVIILEKWDAFAAIRRCCFGKTCFKIIAEKQQQQQQPRIRMLLYNEEKWCIVHENEFQPFNGPTKMKCIIRAHRTWNVKNASQNFHHCEMIISNVAIKFSDEIHYKSETRNSFVLNRN